MRKEKLLKIGLITTLLVALLIMCTACSVFSSFWGSNNQNTKIDIDNLASYNVGSIVANNAIEACGRVISEFSLAGTTIKTAGAGFCITSDGYIVTNRHVVQIYIKNQMSTAYSLTKTKDYTIPLVATNVRVALGDSVLAYETDIEKISGDEDLDIAVLKIKTPAGALSYLEIDKTSEPYYGQEVYTFGNPEGIGLLFTTLKIANPSLKSSSDSKYNVIMLDGNINHGNSGGVLLNSNSKVIGLVYARIESSSGGDNNVYGIGCAIKAQYIINFVNSIQKTILYKEYIPPKGEEDTKE